MERIHLQRFSTDKRGGGGGGKEEGWIGREVCELYIHLYIVHMWGSRKELVYTECIIIYTL
jgi:hypothetical protein